MVLIVNFASVPESVREALGSWWIASPQVSAVAATALLAALSAWFPRLRWIDVVLVGGTGLVAVYVGDGTDIGGVSLVFVAVALASEYGYLEGRTRSKLIVVTSVVVAAVVVAFVASPTVDPYDAALSLVLTGFLIGTGWILISSVLRRERTRGEELEATVAERTAKLAESLAAQKLLLSEIHHRTKNNLQVVASLLYLEHVEADAASTETLNRAQMRIRTLGRAHERLYSATTSATTDIGEYFSDYFTDIGDLASLYGLTVRPVVDVSLRVALDLAIRLGLMVNEIVLNAMQHATGDGRPLTLDLRVTRESGNVVVSVQDDGPGLERSGASPESMGISIIQALADTLHARATVNGSHGVQWRIEVPMDALEEPATDT